MIGFNRRFDPNFAALQQRLRRRRGRRGRARHHPLARPRPAAGLLHRALRRALPRHDDPRFRHGALPARRGRRSRSMRSAPRWSTRRSARPATSIPPRCRCRPPRARSAVITNSRRATYGYDQRIEVHGSKGMLSAGNVHKTTVEFSGDEGLHRRSRAELLPRALRRGLPARDRGLHRRDGKGHEALARRHDGLKAQMLADAATKSRETGKPVKIG